MKGHSSGVEHIQHDAMGWSMWAVLKNNKTNNKNTTNNNNSVVALLHRAEILSLLLA